MIKYCRFSGTAYAKASSFFLELFIPMPRKIFFFTSSTEYIFVCCEFHLAIIFENLHRFCESITTFTAEPLRFIQFTSTHSFKYFQFFSSSFSYFFFFGSNLTLNNIYVNLSMRYQVQRLNDI